MALNLSGAQPLDRGKYEMSKKKPSVVWKQGRIRLNGKDDDNDLENLGDDIINKKTHC